MATVVVVVVVAVVVVVDNRAVLSRIEVPS